MKDVYTGNFVLWLQSPERQQRANEMTFRIFFLNLLYYIVFLENISFIAYRNYYEENLFVLFYTP